MTEMKFLVSIEPINENINTDGILQKLRLMAAGCGMRVLSAERVDESEQKKVK